MRNLIIAGILMAEMAASSLLLAQGTGNEVAQLNQRVAQLEKQVQEISQFLETLKAQQARDSRMQARRSGFERRAAQDKDKYTVDQMVEVESMYRGIVENWSSISDATRAERLVTMVRKYPDANRSGCATLDIAEGAQGDRRGTYLREAVEKYSDCFYGDGVQVGPYARFLLAEDFKRNGNEEKAVALYNEIKSKYAEAIDHHGELLVERIKTDSK